MRNTSTHRRYRRPRCLKGQRHRWLFGSALKATDSGHLTSGTGTKGAHLTAACRKCHKVRHFHPYAAKRRVFGVMVAKRRAA